MLRKLLLYCNYLRNKVVYRHIVQHGYNIIFAFKGSSIVLGRGVINSSFSSNMLGLYQRNIIVARHGGKITVKDGFGISGSTIYCTDSISIGANATIGANCKIVDNDFHSLNPKYRMKPGEHTHVRSKAIEIGDNCFIGMNSIILKGTVLGNNVIIGAGSVVSGVFPSDCIIAGNPAKVIKTNANA